MNSARDLLNGGVSPFGHPRINDRSHLPAAFRSVPRPSSPLGAKASTERPCLAHHHANTARTQDQTAPPRTQQCRTTPSQHSLTQTLQPIPDSPVKEHPPGQDPHRGHQPERRLFGSTGARPAARRTPATPRLAPQGQGMEAIGFEPTTPCLQSRCSPS